MKEQQDSPRPQLDFLQVLTEMRSGNVAIDISQKFNEVLEAVRNTAGKGKISVEFTIEPTKLGMGGIVIEVDISHDVKLKKPELKVGAAKFYVRDDGTLTRQDPATEGQETMFDGMGERTRGV